MTATSIVPASAAPAVKPEAGAPAPAPAAPAATATERPSWLPEKFQTPEAMAQAYAALETKLSQGAAPQQTPSAPAADPATTSAQATQDLTQGLAAKGLDIRNFHAEYQKEGKLSDASYSKLAEAGYDKSFINDYIAGQEALFASQAKAIYDSVGGDKHFQSVQAWAKANVPRGELDAFNNIVETGSIDQIRLAVQGLNARYTAANGREPTLVGGEPAAPVGFQSRAEVVAAMSDPRYRKDEAYRAGVVAKMRVSGVFGRR